MKKAATSGQVIAWLAKVLVTYNEEFLPETDGEQIQNAIDEKDGKRVVKNLVRFINNGCNLVVNGARIISSLFQKTTAIIISKNPKDFTINKDSVMKFFQSVMAKEDEKGNPTSFIDNDIWNYFLNKTVPGVLRKFTTTVYRFLQNLTHEKILKEADSLGIKKIYSYLEALSIIRKAILLGEVDKKGTGIIVYFKIEGIDTLCRFDAYRGGGGRLRVGVGGVGLVSEWSAGSGACFSN